DRERHPRRAVVREVQGDRSRQGRLGSAAVLRADRSAERGKAEIAAPAPVAGDRPERREAGAAPVRGEPDRVDSGATDDGYPEAAVAAGAQHGEGVVADLQPVGPVAPLQAVAQLALLALEVGPGDEDDSGRRARGP